MYFQEITFKNRQGLHTRYSAMIVNKASEIQSKYKVTLYIKKKEYSQWLGMSMLAILSLKISNNDKISIGCNEEGMLGKIAVMSLIQYIDEFINSINPSANVKIDEFIDETIIAKEQVLENVPIGILVIDSYENITTINEYALKFLEKSFKDVIGKNIKDIIPYSDLPMILKKGLKQFGQVLHIKNKSALVNRSPLFMNNKIIGAVAVIQDVSNLVGIKELNEKFTKILENSQDMICFLDKNGIINYINPAYIKHSNLKAQNILGKHITDIEPDGYIYKSFKNKSKFNDVIYSINNVNVIGNIEPLFIDDEFVGVISTARPINELKELIGKLNKSQEELNYYKEEFFKQISNNSSFNNIIGSSRTLKDILYICEKTSKTTSTILIRGESGTGKELIAKAVHNNSTRHDKPFVRVNCASIPENLLESELFGYEKGSFTGATKSKPGKFLIADGGTIFLDEIGDMPMSMQVKLLRVLQEMEIDPIGGIDPISIDVRVIAATNRNLEEMIKEKTFRQDLYYRLDVIGINLPALRERKEDIPDLVEYFIKKLNIKLNKNILGISNDALNLLQQYQWPGNIRELENIIERAMNFCDEKYISSFYLPSYLKSTIENPNKFDLDKDNILPFEEYEKQIIKMAIEKYKTFNKAGKALGLTHRTISLKCKKYNIDVKKIKN